MKIRFSHIWFVASLPLLLSSCLEDTELEQQQKQFKREQNAIDNYLSDLGKSYQVDPYYELRYFLEGTGNDTVVQADDYVQVSCSGYVLGEETPFVSKDTVLNLAYQLAGWRVLLPKSEVNQTITMFIPSAYGYGRYGSDAYDVSPNETLMYEVETIKAHDGFTYQQFLIDSYLESNELEYEIDSTQNLRFIMLEQGTGSKPTKTSSVKVSYKGSIFNGSQFDAAENVTFNLGGLISGWGVLMPYVKEGGKIKMFLPARFAYGQTPVGSIPPNSILVFEVTLLDVL